MIAAAFMIAHQVAAKATRDALFLSKFSITALPTMLVGASLLAIVSVVITSRVLTKVGPAKLISPAFGLSSLLLIIEWKLIEYHPKLGAVAVYAHMAVFGSILISGFWSTMNERFDPRAARRLVARIGTGGTIGGLAGGLLAIKAADSIPVSTMIPLLAAMHAICALVLFRLRTGGPIITKRSTEAPYRSGIRILKERPYLRDLAVLILLGTISAALIDYVFKARASLISTEEDTLLRFFAYYYTAIGLTSVLVQSSLSRLSLKKLGLANTVGTLPAVVALGSFGVFLIPALLAAVLAKGAEAVVRNSLFRSAYEALYTPIPPEEKRATKSIIDVGFDRLGDALGGGIARLILLLFAQTAQAVMLLLALLLALLGLYVAKRLHRGYVNTLERSLRAKAIALDISEVDDKTTRQTMLTMALPINFSAEDSSSMLASPVFVPKSQAVPPLRLDPVVKKIEDLTSGDPETVRRVLRSSRSLETDIIPFAINLLAWDAVALDAIRSLRRVSEPNTGQLLDRLLDPSQEFAIRRRLPRVLVAAKTQRSADGLLLGLGDQRFEVRFQCGRALARIHDQNLQVVLDDKRVFTAAAREVAVDRRVWESHRLLDQFGESEETAFFEDRFLEERASRSLEHLFTVLSLALPKEPLRIAYRGLHTDDKDLRGTALEYLETILPEEIRQSLWPFLEEQPEAPGEVAKSREEILHELMKSNESIEFSLEQIRKFRIDKT